MKKNYFLLGLLVNMKRLFLSIISFLTLLPLYAEEDYSILYDWHNYTYNGISYIAHDTQNLYIGSHNGIISIDKQTGEQTIMNRVSGLTDNSIYCLKMIGDELWYGGSRNGFGMIKDGVIKNYTRTNYPLFHDAYVKAIAKDADGNIFASSMTDLLKIKDDQCVNTYIFPNSPLSGDAQITAVHVDKKGKIWVGGYDTSGSRGVGLLTENGIDMVYENLERVKKILESPDGTLWMLAKLGLLKYDGSSFTECLTNADGVEYYDMSDMALAVDGTVWLLAKDNLISYDGRSITKYHYESTLPYPLMCIDIDGTDIYITAETNKLLRFKDGKFEQIPLQEDILGQLPYSAFTRGGSIDHDGNYLAGTSGNGLLKLKPDGTCIETDFFKGKYITETVTDNFGDVWVANTWSEHFYLYKITPTDTLMFDESSGCPHLGDQDIFQMAVDHQNRLWIASSNGLYCFDGTTWQTFNKNNSGLTTNRVYCVAFDKDDRLWTSCGRLVNNYYAEIGDGLFCFDGINWTRYISQYDDEVNRATEGYVHLKMPIRTNSIGRIAIDDNNTFWMVINYNEVYITLDIDEIHGGLIRWDGKDEWHQFLSPYTPDPTLPTYEPGEWIDNVDFVLPGNWINDIDIDRYGRLWVSFEGDHGVAMYDGKDFIVWDMDIPGIASGNAYNLAIDKERDRLWVSHPWGTGIGGASTAKIRSGGTDMLSTPRLSPDRHQPSSGKMYNLSGRQIDNPQKGVYIQNGKKRGIK